jgi:hypothetical protein
MTEYVFRYSTKTISTSGTNSLADIAMLGGNSRGSSGRSCSRSNGFRDNECRSCRLCSLKLTSRGQDRGWVLGQNIWCRQSALLVVGCCLFLSCCCLQNYSSQQ